MKYFAIGGGLTFLFVLLSAGIQPYFGYLKFSPWYYDELKRFFNNDQEFTITWISVLQYISLGLVGSQVFHLVVVYFRSKIIKTKENEKIEKRESKRYAATKEKKFKLNDQLQSKWRSKPLDNRVLLGIDELGKPYAIENGELNKHALFVGTTGSGKTTLIYTIIEDALRRKKPIIFVDGKGDIGTIKDIQALCEMYGVKSHVFNEKFPITYNPIRHGDKTVIKDKLMNIMEWSEQFYMNQSENLLQNVIAFMDDYGFPRDLETVAKYLDEKTVRAVLEADVQEKVIKVKAQKTVESPKGSDLDTAFFDDEPSQETIEVEEEKTVKELSDRAKEYRHKFFERYGDKGSAFEGVEGLRTQIYTLLDSQIGDLFQEKEDGIDLIDITNRNEVVMFSLDGMKYGRFLNKLARLVILDVNYLVSERYGRKNEPVVSIYDEFSKYGNPDIVDTINKSRSAGFECIIATQTLADINKVEEGLVDQIIGNCNTYAFGLSNDDYTVQKMVNTLGTYDDTDITYQIEKVGGTLKRIDVKAQMGTVRRVNKYHVPPDQIRNFKTGEFVIWRKAAKDVLDPDIIYCRNPLSEGGKHAVLKGRKGTA